MQIQHQHNRQHGEAQVAQEHHHAMGVSSPDHIIYWSALSLLISKELFPQKRYRMTLGKDPSEVEYAEDHGDGQYDVNRIFLKPHVRYSE